MSTISTISTMVLAAALVASPEPAGEFTWTPVDVPTRSATSDRIDWTPVAMPLRQDPAPPPVVPQVVAPAAPVILWPHPCPPPVVIQGPFVPR